MDIEAYIRSMSSEGVPQFKAIYEGLYPELLEEFYSNTMGFSIRAEVYEPQLRIVKSKRKKASRMTIDGRTLVVYDQYLGTTLNRMNRVWLHSRSNYDGLIVGFRLLGEKLAELSNPYSAFFEGAYEYGLTSLRISFDEDLPVPERLEQLQMCITQELFAICHEVCHGVTADPRANFSTLIPAVREQAEGVLQVLEAHQDRQKTSTEFVRGILETHADRSVTDEELKAYLDNEETATLLDSMWEMDTQQRKRWRSLVEKDDDFAKEMLCDWFAAVTVSNLIQKTFDASYLDTYRHIYVGMMHLRAIAAAESLAYGFYPDDHIETTYRERALSICDGVNLRGLVLRAQATALICDKDQRLGDDFRQHLVYSNERHWECLHNPIAVLLSERSEEVRARRHMSPEELERDLAEKSEKYVGNMLDAESRNLP